MYQWHVTTLLPLLFFFCSCNPPPWHHGQRPATALLFMVPWTMSRHCIPARSCSMHLISLRRCQANQGEEHAPSNHALNATDTGTSVPRAHDLQVQPETSACGVISRAHPTTSTRSVHPVPAPARPDWLLAMAPGAKMASRRAPSASGGFHMMCKTATMENSGMAHLPDVNETSVATSSTPKARQFALTGSALLAVTSSILLSMSVPGAVAVPMGPRTVLKLR